MIVQTLCRISFRSELFWTFHSNLTTIVVCDTSWTTWCDVVICSMLCLLTTSVGCLMCSDVNKLINHNKGEKQKVEKASTQFCVDCTVEAVIMGFEAERYHWRDEYTVLYPIGVFSVFSCYCMFHLLPCHLSFFFISAFLVHSSFSYWFEKVNQILYLFHWSWNRKIYYDMKQCWNQTPENNARCSNKTITWSTMIVI